MRALLMRQVPHLSSSPRKADAIDFCEYQNGLSEIVGASAAADAVLINRRLTETAYNKKESFWSLTFASFSVFRGSNYSQIRAHRVIRG
jgi:hypothetical protein